MFWVQQKLGAQKIGVTARNAPPWLRPVARRTLINDQSFVLKAKCGFQEINCRLEVWSIDYITMIIMRRWLFPFSGFWILNWVISTVRGACMWECAWRHLECLNSGMWYHVQIRPNFRQIFRKYSQKAKFPTLAAADSQKRCLSLIMT